MTLGEIEAQLAAFDREPDAFVAGVGTGGTVMGVGRHLRCRGRPVRIHPLEPANSPTLRTGHKAGRHRIEGISDEFIPSLINLDELDEVIDIWDGDAILMVQALCRSLGLAVGISSGANVLGAMGLVEELDSDATVVTILPDSNKIYLSTNLCHDEPLRDDYLTPNTQLDRFTAVSQTRLLQFLKVGISIIFHNKRLCFPKWLAVWHHNLLIIDVLRKKCKSRAKYSG